MRPDLFRLSLLALALHALPAAAADWIIDPERSSISFDYVRDDASATGTFARFEGTGTFAADDPTAARLTIAIQSKSIDLGDQVESAFATSAEWFDSANHPDVVYTLNALEASGGNVYAAIGTLSIRGRSETVRTPITLEIDGSSAQAAGTVTVDRTNFGLGVGPSALFVDIEREVAVRFDLHARPLQ